MSKSDGAAYAALSLAESMFVGMVRGGSMTRESAREVLDLLALKLADHPEAAAEIKRFKGEFERKTSVQ